MRGIGYQEYKRKRMDEGLSASQIEDPGNERFLIYFGRAHLIDFETKTECRGHLKIGRGKFATAIQRGRNQPGIDFRIYAEIIFDNNAATHIAEAKIKDALSHKNMTFSQGQEEMYNIEDEELEHVVSTMAEIIDAETQHNILEVVTYLDNNISKLNFNQTINKPKYMQTQEIFNNLFLED
jgi:hypothetical protein